MPNNYYNFSPPFVAGTKVRSDQVNTQYQAIETAFDQLPTDITALARGIETYGTEAQGATVNDFVVTMPDTRLTNQEGDEIQFRATHTNTGAATIMVDGIVAVPFVQFDGTPFVAGQIVTGRVYEARYDNVNTRFILSQSTDGAQQVLYAEEWAVNPVGVAVSVAAGGDGVSTFSAFHWATTAGSIAVGMQFLGNHDASTGAPATPTSGNPVYRISVAGSFDSVDYNVSDYTIWNGTVFQKLSIIVGSSLVTDIATATPPTTEAVTGEFSIFDADNNDQLAGFGFNGSNKLQIRNLFSDDGGDIEFFIGAETVPVVRLTRLNAGNERGVYIMNDDTGNQDTGLFFTDSNEVVRGRTSFQGGTAMDITNLLTGGRINLAVNGSETLVTADGLGTPDVSLNSGSGASNEINLRTESTGVVVGNGSNSVAAPTARLRFQGDILNGVGAPAFVGWDGTPNFVIENGIDGGEIIVRADNGVGTTVELIRADPDGEVQLFSTSQIFPSIETRTSGLAVRGSTGNDPAASGVQDVNMALRNSGGTDVGTLNYLSTTDLSIRNLVHGGSVFLEAEDIGGTLRTLISGDPDVGIAGFFGGAQRFATITNGIEVQGSVAASATPVEADSPDTQAHFVDLNGVQLAELGYQSNSTFGMFNLVRGGQMTWRGTSTAGAVRVLCIADPDGAFSLSHIGVAGARTLTAATGGFEVNNTLDGGGFERVATIAEGSFTANTYGGWSSDPDWDFEYQRIGRTVTLHLASTSTPTGTSNAAVMSAAGLPTDIRPSASVQTVSIAATENGASADMQASIGSTGTIAFVRTDGAAITASGVKGLLAGATIVYMLD